MSTAPSPPAALTARASDLARCVPTTGHHSTTGSTALTFPTTGNTAPASLALADAPAFTHPAASNSARHPTSTLHKPSATNCPGSATLAAPGSTAFTHAASSDPTAFPHPTASHRSAPTFCRSARHTAPPCGNPAGDASSALAHPPSHSTTFTHSSPSHAAATTFTHAATGRVHLVDEGGELLPVNALVGQRRHLLADAILPGSHQCTAGICPTCDPAAPDRLPTFPADATTYDTPGRQLPAARRRSCTTSRSLPTIATNPRSYHTSGHLSATSRSLHTATADHRTATCGDFVPTSGSTAYRCFNHPAAGRCFGREATTHDSAAADLYSSGEPAGRGHTTCEGHSTHTSFVSLGERVGFGEQECDS